MRKIRQITAYLGRKLALTPDQAEHLATIKFRCC